MKKSFIVFFIIAFTLLLGSHQIGYAQNPIEANCSNGVQWKYENGTFYLFEFESLVNNLNQHDSMLCVVGIYSPKNEQLLKCQIKEIDSSYALNYVELPCNVDDLIEYKIKFFFWKTTMHPLCDAETFDIFNVAPTCLNGGYQSVYSHSTGNKSIYNAVPALGHSFGEDETIQEAGIVECGYKNHSCTRCELEENFTYYTDMEMARLCMYGDLTGIGKKSEVPITVSFKGEGKQFENYALLKYQGHTSLMYDKKNFTLKLFKDSARTNKNKIVFRDWKKEHKYILKANYVDPSVCRNLISADVWSEMVACREGHSERLDKCSNYGATDGFPIALYLNDEFIGLYTMTLHRDDDLFDMDDDVMDAIAVTNTNHQDASRFKDEATFDDVSDWEVEFNGLADDTWVENKVNQFIEFVRTSSDEEFKTHLSSYMDVNSAIDYLIAIYGLGITENGSKNLTLASYSDGAWIMSLCDMECAFGLKSDGNGYYSPEYFLPVYDNSTWVSNTDSLLWDRILNNFYPELKARYTHLRNTVLIEEAITKKVNAFTLPIAEEFYEADAKLYPDMPQLDIPATEQICEYINQRLALLDKALLQENAIGGLENE